MISDLNGLLKWILWACVTPGESGPVLKLRLVLLIRLCRSFSIFFFFFIKYTSLLHFPI